MPNKYFEITDRNPILITQTYHVADTPKKALAAVGVVLADGERASQKKSYRAAGDDAPEAYITYREISAADYEAHTMLKAITEALATPVPELKTPTVTVSRKPAPPAGRRSRSMFGNVARA